MKTTQMQHFQWLKTKYLTSVYLKLIFFRYLYGRHLGFVANEIILIILQEPSNLEEISSDIYQAELKCKIYFCDANASLNKIAFFGSVHVGS